MNDQHSIELSDREQLKCDVANLLERLNRYTLTAAQIRGALRDIIKQVPKRKNQNESAHSN